jgi:hypothetical protein
MKRTGAKVRALDKPSLLFEFTHGACTANESYADR